MVMKTINTFLPAVIIAAMHLELLVDSALAATVVEWFEFTAYNNAAVINMPAAGMSIRERRRIRRKGFSQARW